MTRAEKIAAIQQACVQANPEIERKVFYKWHPIRAVIQNLARKQPIGKMTLRDIAASIGQADASPQKIKHHLEMLYRIENLQPRSRRAIRLADVILLIHVKTGYDKRGYHGEDAPEWSIAIDDLVNCHWNLRRDDLNLQDDPCIDFLADLLPKKA